MPSKQMTEAGYLSGYADNTFALVKALLVNKAAAIYGKSVATQYERARTC